MELGWWVGINWQRKLFASEADARAAIPGLKEQGRSQFGITPFTGVWYNDVVAPEGAVELEFHF